MSDEPDIRLQIRVKNARILRAMKAAGIPSVSELCRRCAVRNEGLVGKLINFKVMPIDRVSGQWKETAISIATALHREPDELWPEYLQRIEARRTETHIDVSIEQMAALVGGERSMLRHDVVARLLPTLSPRYRKVIEMRFGLAGNGEHTLDEAGERLGIGMERVRQIERKALSKMAITARRKLGESFQ